jgi:SAM-dependent methyltransferase
MEVKIRPMNALKDFVRTRFPALVRFVNWLINRTRMLSMSFRSPQAIFTDIYRRNSWGNPDSVSGPGSNLQQTATVVLELPKLIEAYQVTSILDVPCGDFFWMKTVDIGAITYIGGDIVKELIASNNTNFANEHRKFVVMDILNDPLPAVDLIFCRDCLVHLSFKDVRRALGNFKASGSKYLVTTTFTRNDKIADIATGQWRPINFCLAPFNFPEPMKIITEHCTSGNGAYSDKSLGVWKIADLPSARQ